MRPSEVLQGLRAIKLTSILSRYDPELNQMEAAELLGIAARMLRYWAWFEHSDDAGLLDRRPGKALGKGVAVDREHDREAYRDSYSGFTAVNFHGQLFTRHNHAWSSTWTNTFLHIMSTPETAERRRSSILGSIRRGRLLDELRVDTREYSKLYRTG